MVFSLLYIGFSLQQARAKPQAKKAKPQAVVAEPQPKPAAKARAAITRKRQIENLVMEEVADENADPGHRLITLKN